MLFGSEIQKPDAHGVTNMPLMLAGNGGGMRTGRYLKYCGAAAQQPPGIDPPSVRQHRERTFGNTRYATGPLNGPSLT